MTTHLIAYNHIFRTETLESNKNLDLFYLLIHFDTSARSTTSYSVLPPITRMASELA